MALTHQQKAIRFAKRIKRLKTKDEKREYVHALCEYLVALNKASPVKPVVR